MAKIAVEDSLDSIKEALQKNGYEVVPATESNVASCECCVISGQDKNVMGISEIVTEAPVINAQGMTADQVVDQVSQRVKAIH